MFERGPHALVSDVTPWWWTSHREGGSRAVAGALVLKAFMRLDDTPRIVDVSVGIDGITVKFDMEDSADASRLQSFAEELRTRLDGLVSTGAAT